MSQLKLRRGSTVSHAGFTGADGEVTFNTDTNALVTHDGATAGGFPHVKAADLAASSGASLVGYMPSGVGAVARTVQDELRRDVYAENFGAVGDGITDDYTAIQNAINAVGNAGGGKILFGAKIYKITQGLVDNGKTVILVGKASNEDPTNSGNATIIYAVGAISGWTITGNRSGARDITIKGDNGTFDGNIAGFVISGSKSSLENCSAINNRGHGFMYLYGNQSYFCNLLGLGNKGHGIYIGDSITSVDDNASAFVHIDMRVNGGSGVYIDSSKSFANNFYNLVVQGNGAWGLYCDSTYNNVYGMYEEASVLGPIKFEVNSANNRVKGILTATWPPMSDSSTSQKNWVEGYNASDYYQNPTVLDVGDKNGGTPGYIRTYWDGTQWVTSLTANGTSPNFRFKSTGGGKLLLKSDIESPIAPTLLNSWTNFDGSRVVAGYYKDLYDRVCLQGTVKKTAPATVEAIFTLPAGYRPPGRVQFAVKAGSGEGAGSVGFVMVDSDGNVYYNGGVSTDEFSLDGICFRTV